MRFFPGLKQGSFFNDKPRDFTFKLMLIRWGHVAARILISSEIWGPGHPRALILANMLSLLWSPKVYRSPFSTLMLR